MRATSTPPHRSGSRAAGRLIVALIIAAGAGSFFVLRDDGSATTDALVPTTAAEAVETTEVLGEPYIGPLTFGWPANCVVPVRESVNNAKGVADITYSLSTVPEGENLVVSITDMKAVTENGSPVAGDAAALLATKFALPSFVIDPSGVVVEVRGMADVVTAMGVTDPQMAAAMTPERIASLESSMTFRSWDSWVGFWSTFGSIDEPRSERIVPTTAGGASFDTTLVVESLGIGSDGQARLRHQEIIDGENYRRSIAPGGYDELPAEQQGHQITTIDVTIDPLTLRANSARFVLEAGWTNGATTTSYLETYQWTMDWAGATCA